MSNSISSNQFDVITIGSGLGGLTAAALLAQRGKKVLVLEQHIIPGGCATTFKRKSYKVEVGLNAMGGMDSDDAKNPYFKELGIPEQVNFLKLNEFYSYKSGNTEFVMPNSFPENRDALMEEFPDEAKAIQRYFTRLLKVRKQLNKFCSWSFRKQKVLIFFLPFVLPAIVFNMFSTVGGLLRRQFKNTELQNILLANLAYFHDDPKELSFLYYAAGQGEYYQGGGYYIQGGSQNLSDHLVRVITERGGEVRFRSEVVAIATEKNRVTGVSYVQRKGAEKNHIRVQAPVVISNASIPQVLNNLLDASYRKKIGGMFNKLSLSPSFFMVFLVFRRPLKEIGMSYYSNFFGTPIADSKRSLPSRDAYFQEAPFYFCDYSQLDAQLSEMPIGQGVICCNDRLERWKDLSNAIYKQEKDRMAQILIDRLEREHPGIKAEIDHYEAGTPKTVQRYIRTPGGSVYGFAQTTRQAVPFRPSVKSPITGLYFASAWAFPGGGFSGSMLSGITCANAIVPCPKVQKG